MTEPSVMRWDGATLGEGDVILDGRVDGHKHGYLAFRHRGKAWIPSRTHKLTADWFGGVGVELKPHPNADEVWADYCAWRLTQ
jgi:hypothetical protein